MFKSAVGAKLVMAVTGLLLFGFVIAHLLGNLQTFIGPEALNAYALHLRDLGPVLWVGRIVLILALLTHISAAIWLTRKNMDARPEAYAFQQDFPNSTTMSRHMLLTGWLILAFLAYHLAHFTFQVTHPEYRELHWKLADGRTGHDVYNMVVAGFQSPWLVGLYLVAQLFLWMHLSHAISSVLQTLGLKNPKNERLVDAAGPVVATLIAIGYVSIPLAVLTGVVRAVTQS